MGFYDNDSSNKELTHEEETSLDSEIARREQWLKSYDMAAYTSPDDLHVTQGKYGSRTRKDSVHVPIDHGAEKVPGLLSKRFEEHIDRLKDECLTSSEWIGARHIITQALKQHKIEKVVVIGLGSLYRYTSDHLSWQWEIAFILAIFDLIKPQNQPGTSPPTLIFQDPFFTHADTLLLTSLNGTIVTHPTAFDLIDPHTFLFAMHPPHLLYFTRLLQSNPGICITNTLESSLEAGEKLQRCSGEMAGVNLRDVVKGFMRGRVGMELPGVWVEWDGDVGEGPRDFLQDIGVFWIMEEERY